jgi:hypothetical protein
MGAACATSMLTSSPAWLLAWGVGWVMWFGHNIVDESQNDKENPTAGLAPAWVHGAAGAVVLFLFLVVWVMFVSMMAWIFGWDQPPFG